MKKKSFIRLASITAEKHNRICFRWGRVGEIPDPSCDCCVFSYSYVIVYCIVIPV